MEAAGQRHQLSPGFPVDTVSWLEVISSELPAGGILQEHPCVNSKILGEGIFQRQEQGGASAVLEGAAERVRNILSGVTKGGPESVLTRNRCSLMQTTTILRSASTAQSASRFA